MSNVVSLTDKRNKALAAIKEETPTLLQPSRVNLVWDGVSPSTASEDLNWASDAVLGALQDNFDEGVCIGILGNKVQVASTMDDVDQVIWLLEEALQDLYKEYPEGENE